jgi:hypothetical protein
MHNRLILACAVLALAVPAYAKAGGEGAASARGAKPVARFAALLRGHMFRQFSNSRDAGGFQSELTLHLCSNGRFVFDGQSVVPGDATLGVDSQVEREHQEGTWKVVRARFDAAGNGGGVVQLKPTGGQAGRMLVNTGPNGSALAGKRAFRVRSNRCR